MDFKLNMIEEALEDLKLGKMIIIVDDENRENEGDLVVAAEFATPDAINFMVKEARGIVCTPMLEKDLNRLQIPLMVEHNTDNHETAFTVSIDHVSTTTGVSPFERSKTILALLDKHADPQDFRRPGHVFPLKYRAGGVLVRTGHTEASIDMCRLAGLKETSVICEITNDDGTMSRMADLQIFAQKHNLKMISVAELIEYRKFHDNLVFLGAQSQLPTKFGDFQIFVFQNPIDQKEHLAIVKGDIAGKENVLTRIHSECMTGDVFGSQRCDCGEQLETALRTIEKKGEGVLLYMRQEGRGIGLTNKIKAYALQEKGYDTVEANEQLGFPADMREYSLSAQILRFLNVKSVCLLTNNPLKTQDLKHWGVEVTKRVPIIVKANKFNEKYLITKAQKMGHMMKDTAEL